MTALWVDEANTEELNILAVILVKPQIKVK